MQNCSHDDPTWKSSLALQCSEKKIPNSMGYSMKPFLTWPEQSPWESLRDRRAKEGPTETRTAPSAISLRSPAFFSQAYPVVT